MNVVVIHPYCVKQKRILFKQNLSTHHSLATVFVEKEKNDEKLSVRHTVQDESKLISRDDTAVLLPRPPSQLSEDFYTVHVIVLFREGKGPSYTFIVETMMTEKRNTYTQ